jgi:polyhydroxyalkanoate synthase
MMRAVPCLLTLAACGPKRPAVPDHCAAAQTLRVPTADGATVQLHRHPHDGPPVLLVHGLGSRGRFWDLSASQSMAVALNDAGFDAWVVDLRGHGGNREDADGGRLPVGWTLDDYGRYDLPAAIDHVRATTGYERVGYIGHSMGGMVAAAYHAWHGDDALAALIIVGSPVDFSHPDPFHQASVGALRMGAALPTFRTDSVATNLPGRGNLPFDADALLFQRDNLDEDTRELMFEHGTGPVTRGEMLHLAEILHTGRFGSRDQTHDYVAELDTLATPLLVVAGRADGVAPPDRVYPFYAQAGSADKRWVLAGRENGFAADYSHLDLCAGVNAPREIHPILLAFLEGRWDPPAAP